MTLFNVFEKPGIVETIGLALQDAYAGVEWSPEKLNLSGEYETLYLNTVEDISDMEVVDARILPDGRFLVSIEANLDCNFDVFIYKMDFLLVQDDPRLSIIDSDWNKHYLFADIALPLRSNINLVVDTSGSDSEKPNIEALYMKPIISGDERPASTNLRRNRH